MKLLTFAACMCTGLLAHAQLNTSTLYNALWLDYHINSSQPPAPNEPPLLQLSINDQNTVQPLPVNQVLFIDRNGNAGFGTNAPQARFQVGKESSFHLKMGPAFQLANGNTSLFNIAPGGNVTAYGDLIVSQGNTINCRIYNDGLIRAREVKVDLDAIPPDYVFDEQYHLCSWQELEQYIKANRHLPGIPSASAMQQEGSINIGAFQLKLLEKIEELSLYMLELQKENEALKAQVCAIENQ